MLKPSIQSQKSKIKNRNCPEQFLYSLKIISTVWNLPSCLGWIYTFQTKFCLLHHTRNKNSVRTNVFGLSSWWFFWPSASLDMDSDICIEISLTRAQCSHNFSDVNLVIEDTFSIPRIFLKGSISMSSFLSQRIRSDMSDVFNDMGTLRHITIHSCVCLFACFFASSARSSKGYGALVEIRGSISFLRFSLGPAPVAQYPLQLSQLHLSRLVWPHSRTAACFHGIAITWQLGIG